MATGTKEWNVMVYLAGDNNLTSEMVWALTEMERFNSDGFVTAQLKLMARFDPRGARPRSYNFNKTKKTTAVSNLDSFIDSAEETKELGKIKNIKKKQLEAAAKKRSKFAAKTKELDSPAQIEKFLAEQSADPAAVEAFVDSNFDHTKYNMLVLSGHANGAAGEFLQDTDPVSSLSIPRFREVLKRVVAEKGKGENISILGMDTCVMSMIEVCYEVRDCVDFLVGAEGFEQNIGWPYHQILRKLKSDPQPSPAEFSKGIVAAYNAYYRDYETAGISTDLAACDLSQIGPRSELIKAVAKLAGQLKTELSTPATKDAVKNAILVAHWEAQSYLNDQYVDLYDFCDRLARLFGVSTPIHTDCTSITGILDAGKVVLKSCYTGSAVQHSHGLSIYFPWSAEPKELEEYGKLSFGKKTGWLNFLKIFVEKTRRDPRPGSGEKIKNFDLPLTPSVVVPSFSPLRSSTGCRGLSFSTGSIKNPPDGFFRDDCS